MNHNKKTTSYIIWLKFVHQF